MKFKKSVSPVKKSRPNKKTAPSSSSERALWKGYITFGLIHIPIGLYSAQKPEEGVHFKLLAKDNLAGIEYSRINETTREEVLWKDIVKGYEYKPGNYVVLTQKDLGDLIQVNQKTIEIEHFIHADEMGSLYFDKPYYVLPDKGAYKAYGLLRETLKNSRKIGIARMTIRKHPYLAAVSAQNEAIIINTLRYPQEIKGMDEVNIPHDSLKNYPISQEEFKAATQLVETMTMKWEPKRYTNEYREALLRLIKEKINHQAKAFNPENIPNILDPNAIDFSDLLQQSIDYKKTGINPSEDKK